MQNLIELTTDNMDVIFGHHDFVVVDFWAPWCAPCKVMSQVITEVAQEYSDVLFAKINIDDQPDIAQEFHVQSVPRLLIMRNKTVVYDDAGALTVSALKELLDKARVIDLA